MNGPLSDGNENIIDIFVLSTSSTESPVQAGSLEQLGYRITFFNDSNELFESLRSGKPNLLICDSVTFHDDAYDLCRSIKADLDLWVVPVLIVTEASNLADLLHVLDCNADNFISYPYDPSYFTSLIEGMLSTPVERQTPEQIKTQFKIQHDEHMFVVTADRRRLLEFLLSSFEIAVNRSGDLSRAKEENESLSVSLKKSEGLARDLTRSIEAVNTSLRHKEQEINTLVTDTRNKDRQIAEFTEEVQRLAKEIESDKPLLAAAEEQLRRLDGELVECTRQHTAETGELREQLSLLSESLAVTKKELQATKEALVVETSVREDTEKNLSETTMQQELAEKAARALTLECEQLRVSLAAEKSRAQSAESETKALFQAKAESEQDLTRIISELKDTAKQQGVDLQRQKEELEDGNNRIINLEIQLANLRAEKERREEEMHASADTYARNVADLQGALDSTRTALGERQQELDALKTDLGGVTEARDTVTRDLEVLSAELGSLKAAFSEEKEQRYAAEERLNGEIRERDAALQSLKGDHQTARTELDEHRSTLSQVRGDLDAALATRSDLQNNLDAATARIRVLESELQKASASAAEAGQQAGTLTADLERVKSELEQSRALLGETGSSLGSEKEEKARISRELESAIAERADLESRLGTASARIGELESGLKTAVTESTHTGKQVHALADELEQAKAELETAGRLRHTIEESLAGEKREKERILFDLQRISRERESLQAALEKEMQLRGETESEQQRILHLLTSAETEGKSQETTLSATIRELTAELESSNALRGGLEEQVRALQREKQLAEEKASSLSSEIDQARTALADEWEDHMNAQERLIAAEHEKQQLEQSLQRSVDPETEQGKRREIIVKTTDLPAEIRKQPQSLTTVSPAVPAESAVPRITNVDDLFEEDECSEEDEEVPTVSIIREPSSDDEDEPAGAGGEPGTTDLPDQMMEDEETAPEDVCEDDDESTPEDEPDSSDEDAEGIPTGISFNRAQWFDLLKWAHHSGTLTQDQRMQIVRMGRLIQKGRRLTHKQEEQVMEMLSLVRAQGYRFT